MIVVRQMTEGDDSAVCEISAQCFRFAAEARDFTPQQVAMALQEYCSREHVASLRLNGAGSVAELDGAVVGVVVTRDDSIQVLLVRPVAHRQGVGRALFRYAEEEIAKAGHALLRLKTAASAMPFYSAMGIARTGAWRPGGGPLSGAGLIVLEKPMKP
jgi:GNAT superfamily N-acetyltransferase